MEDRAIERLVAGLRREVVLYRGLSSLDPGFELPALSECEDLAIFRPDAGFQVLLRILDEGVLDEVEDMIAYTFWDELLAHGDTASFEGFVQQVEADGRRRTELLPLIEYVDSMTGIHPRVVDRLRSLTDGSP